MIIFDIRDFTKLIYFWSLPWSLKQGPQLAAAWRDNTCKELGVHMWPIPRDKFSELWQGPSIYKSLANLLSKLPSQGL